MAILSEATFAAGQVTIESGERRISIFENMLRARN